jgi:acyl-CoA-binding protein
MNLSKTIVIPRLYYHYELWEEYKYNMWTPITGLEHDNLLKVAISFTGDAIKYGKYMLKVIDKWYISCAVNLSNRNMNRQAWIGHAATCLAIKCLESITREAWHYLTQKQQDDANEKADNAIMLWENKFEKGYQICLNLV